MPSCLWGLDMPLLLPTCSFPSTFCMLPGVAWQLHPLIMCLQQSYDYHHHCSWYNCRDVTLRPINFTGALHCRHKGQGEQVCQIMNKVHRFTCRLCIWTLYNHSQFYEHWNTLYWTCLTSTIFALPPTEFVSFGSCYINTTAMEPLRASTTFYPISPFPFELAYLLRTHFLYSCQTLGPGLVSKFIDSE